MTAAGRINNALPEDIHDDIHGVPDPIGLANTPRLYIPRLSALPDDTSCKKPDWVTPSAGTTDV